MQSLDNACKPNVSTQVSTQNMPLMTASFFIRTSKTTQPHPSVFGSPKAVDNNTVSIRATASSRRQAGTKTRSPFVPSPASLTTSHRSPPHRRWSNHDQARPEVPAYQDPHRTSLLLHQCLQGRYGLFGHHGAVWPYHRKIILALHQGDTRRTRSQDC